MFLTYVHAHMQDYTLANSEIQNFASYTKSADVKDERSHTLQA